MPNSLESLTTEQLERVLALRRQIDALKNELNQITGEEGTPAAAPAKRGRPKGKRSFSPEVRQKMAEAARKRWAARKAQAAAPAKGAKPAGKKKATNPKILAALKKARAARAAKRAAKAA